MYTPERNYLPVKISGVSTEKNGHLPPHGPGMAADSDSKIDKWVVPSTCVDGQLSAQNVHQWKEQGFCFVDKLLPVELIEMVKKDTLSIFPGPETEQAKKITDFGDGSLSFPSKFDSINNIVLHANIHKAVSLLLDVPDIDIRLTQGELWPKYGYSSNDPYSNSDQRIHCDFPNHTLTHPPRWYEPDAVEMIVYFNSVEECQGATAVVPRTGVDDKAYQYPIFQMPGFGLLQWKNNKNCAEEYLQQVAPLIADFRASNLYPREKYARFGVGSVLIYRHDTWHRGTELIPGLLIVFYCQ